MAGEIQLQYITSGATVYALVRNSVGQVWQTTSSTFVTYVTANLANYTIAMTEQGTASRYYAGTFPAAAAGIYSIAMFQRAGGSAAETDTVAGVQDYFQWDGAAVPLPTVQGSNAATTFAGLTTGALACTTITASGAVAFQSTFAVTTSTSLAALSATTVTFSGAVAFQSTFAVTTSTALAALSCTTLTASGAVAFQSTFATTGTTTFNALTVTNATTLSGAVSLGSTLTVTGTATWAAWTQVGAASWGTTTWATATDFSSTQKASITTAATAATPTIAGTQAFNNTGVWSGNINGNLVGDITGNVNGHVLLSVGSVDNVDNVWAVTTRQLTPTQNFNNAGTQAVVTTVTNAVTLSAGDSPVMQSGTASAGGASTITIQTALGADSLPVGCTIKITSGTGAKQARVITAYVDATKVTTVDRAWTTNPDATSVYSILYTDLPALATGLKISGVVLVDTLTTYTGNTVQTGDSFARIGSTGSGLTSLAPSATALSNVQWTNTLATNLGTLASHDPGATIGTSTLTQTQVSGGAYALNSSSFAFNAGLDFTTTQKAATLARVTLVDTITTYTGNTVQTGDSFARIGATGSGLTTLAPAISALHSDIWTGTLATNIGILAGHDPGSTLASQTNITAGTITTVTNLTNAPTSGDFTSAMKTSLNAATPASITNVDNVWTVTTRKLTANGLDNITAWTVDITGTVSGNAPAATALSTAQWTNTLATNLGTTNSTVATNLNATITSRMATYVQPTGFLAATFPATVASTTNITAASGITIGTNGITAAGIDSGALTAAVWDELIAGHTASGTFGGALNAAGSSGDPWSTTLPGAYAVGTAGYIVGTFIDDTITSRMQTYTQPTGFLASTFPVLVASTTNITAATGIQISMTQPVPTSNAAETVGDALNAARAQGFGKWTIVGTTLTLYADDATTPVRVFTLDSATAPTSRT